MTATSPQRRLYILGNPAKPHVEDAVAELAGLAQNKVELLGADLCLEGGPAVAQGADRIIVLGGDGTLIGVARSLGSDQIPLIGVNMGKLGFLTEYSLEELRQDFDRALSDDALVMQRMMLEVVVERNGLEVTRAIAVNDCVIQMGPPFRMIELDVFVDDSPLTRLRGDGVIVCTPSGSTAHNLSAGGPIMQASIHAIGLTPLNPHSLTHRPLVIDHSSEIVIHANAINAGSAAIIDGQVTCPLQVNDRVRIRRFVSNLKIVRNDARPRWHSLVSKLYWGTTPTDK